MRVLYHHRTLAEDGQAVHIRAMISAFRSEGHTLLEKSLISRDRTDCDISRSEGQTGWSFTKKIPRSALELSEYAYSVPAQFRLTRAGRQFKPDFIYERYAFGNAGGVIAAKRLEVPLVLEVNSPLAEEIERTRGCRFPGLARRWESIIFHHANIVCVVTSVLGDLLAAEGVDADCMIVTPNGVDTSLYANPDRIAARRDLGLPEHCGMVLGFTGYYRDWHRLDLVIPLLADPLLADTHLVLIGSGPAELELRQMARKFNVLDRVHFAGERRHEEIPGLLSAVDIGLVPAINPYASPLKLQEYMAAGLPTIAPDQQNLRETLQNGENAILVANGSGAAIREAIVALIEDPELRLRLGRCARETIRKKKLTWQNNARSVIEAVQVATEKR